MVKKLSALTALHHASLTSLAFRQVSFAYPDGPTILSQVDFEFPLNGYARIAAPDGTGQSTVLKILGGLRAPIDGRMEINGGDFFATPKKQREPIQLSIGFGFDHGGLLSNYTLLNNLMLPINYHQCGPREDRLARGLAYLEHFGIVDDVHKQPAFVSASIRKACVLARALALEPRLLILDEPTDSLSEIQNEKLSELIEWHRRERGLQQVIVSARESSFIHRFNFETIELVDSRLVRSSDIRNGTHG
jgi:ABC-type transporter Mla maintaining outer membrane lipid asymmetry ATPase subunit MlaF